jgi:hypothetical protein
LGEGNKGIYCISYTFISQLKTFTSGEIDTVLCGFTACKGYENQFISDYDMDTEEFWKCNNCNLEIDDNGYNGNGFIVTKRSKTWAGIYQDLNLSLINRNVK